MIGFLEIWEISCYFRNDWKNCSKEIKASRPWHGCHAVNKVDGDTAI